MIKYIKSLYAKWQRGCEVKKYKDSKDPWVVIRGEAIDPVRGLKLDLDWNAAFINHLRVQGVKGTSDEDVVAFWLTMIHQQLLGAEDGMTFDESEDE